MEKQYILNNGTQILHTPEIGEESNKNEKPSTDNKWIAYVQEKK